MALNPNAIIDSDYWGQVYTGADRDPEQLDELINFASSLFESFCNRQLVERVYTYVSDDENEENNIFYKPEYTVFDAPINNVFWFPTYPVKSITSFSISGSVITEAITTDYTATDGYILKKSIGKLIYAYGFDYSYLQNIYIVWSGGYSVNDSEFSILRHLCFLFIKDLINSPKNMTLKSEKIGQYNYATIPTNLLSRFYGLSPFVFNSLKKFRREVFA